MAYLEDLTDLCRRRLLLGLGCSSSQIPGSVFSNQIVRESSLCFKSLYGKDFHRYTFFHGKIPPFYGEKSSL